MKSEIPEFISPYLWSYDVSRLDLEKDKKRIITNVLNYGTKEATDWLFQMYKKEDIAEAIKHPFPGEWNKKSMRFWSLILGVQPGSLLRRIA